MRPWFGAGGGGGGAFSTAIAELRFFSAEAVPSRCGGGGEGHCEPLCFLK